MMDQPVSMGQGFAKCGFEIVPLPGDIAGEMRATVYEVGGVDPVTIIDVNQSWRVEVEVELRGRLVRHLCGELCVCLHIECFGSQDPNTNPCIRIPLDPCKTPAIYKFSFEMQAGQVSGGECGNLCCLAVTLTSFDPCGKPGILAGYCKGPCIMFYDGAIS